MVEENIKKNPYRITRIFCTLCGKEFYGTVESHFFLDHKDIRKRYLPLYDVNTFRS